MSWFCFGLTRPRHWSNAGVALPCWREGHSPSRSTQSCSLPADRRWLFQLQCPAQGEPFWATIQLHGWKRKTGQSIPLRASWSSQGHGPFAFPVNKPVSLPRADPAACQAAHGHGWPRGFEVFPLKILVFSALLHPLSTKPLCLWAQRGEVATLPSCGFSPAGHSGECDVSVTAQK